MALILIRANVRRLQRASAAPESGRRRRIAALTAALVAFASATVTGCGLSTDVGSLKITRVASSDETATLVGDADGSSGREEAVVAGKYEVSGVAIGGGPRRGKISMTRSYQIIGGIHGGAP